MPGNSATLQIEIAVDDKGSVKLRQLGDEAQKAGQKGEKGFTGMRRTIGDFNSSLESSVRRLTGLHAQLAALASGYTLARIGKHALDTASSFELMERKLDALTKGRGTETLEEINRWAIEMPINTKKAIDTFSMMKAYGLDPTIESMETLVDVSVMFGEEALPGVARALGQMRALNKVTYQELMQLANAGINARKYLTDAFGMTVEEIQAAGIEVQKAIDAIVSGMEKDFGGAARSAMNSWMGLTATFESYVIELERQVMGAGVFAALKTYLGEINTRLKDLIANNQDLIAQKVPEYLGSMESKIASLYGSVKTIYDLYDMLPDEVAGAAGYGLIGTMLFGGQAGKIIFVVTTLNNALESLNLNLGKLTENYDTLQESMDNIGDVIAGRKDWNTGATITPGGDVFSGKIGPETPNWDVYQAGIGKGRTTTSPGAATPLPGGDNTPADREWIQEISDQFEAGRRQMRELAAKAAEEAEAARQEIYADLLEFQNAKMDRDADFFRGMEGAARRAKDLLKTVEDQGKSTADQMDRDADFFRGMEGAARRAKDLLKTVEDQGKSTADQMAQVMVSTFGSMTDALVQFTTTGKFQFSDMVGSMVADLARLTIQQNITGPLSDAISGIDWKSLFSPSAHGNVFAGRGISAYNNQIVDSPIFFPFAKGIGIAGEGGRPEAIMPLVRTSGGDLGVKAQGAGEKVAVNVVVHNNAPGTQATARSTQGPDGEQMIEVIIDQVEARMASGIRQGGGRMARAIEAQYGLNRAYGAYS